MKFKVINIISVFPPSCKKTKDLNNLILFKIKVVITMEIIIHVRVDNSNEKIETELKNLGFNIEKKASFLGEDGFIYRSYNFEEALETMKKVNEIMKNGLITMRCNKIEW